VSLTSRNLPISAAPRTSANLTVAPQPTMAVMRCEISNAPPDPCAAIAAAHFGFSSLLRYSSRSVRAVPPLAAMGGGRDSKGLASFISICEDLNLGEWVVLCSPHLGCKHIASTQGASLPINQNAWEGAQGDRNRHALRIHDKSMGKDEALSPLGT